MRKTGRFESRCEHVENRAPPSNWARTHIGAGLGHRILTTIFARQKSCLPEVDGDVLSGDQEAVEDHEGKDRQQKHREGILRPPTQGAAQIAPGVADLGHDHDQQHKQQEPHTIKCGDIPRESSLTLQTCHDLFFF